MAAESSPPAPPPECSQFDFWIGEWTVTAPDGSFQGTNRIEQIAGGWGLLENWTGNPAVGNSTGKSLNTWNPGKRQWQQFWVGSGGSVLELAGGLVEGSMILHGDHEMGGKRIIERITWTPLADGSVRQRWEQSMDGGATWETAFDGLYRRKS